MLLANHGLFTWADTSEERYHNALEAVARATRALNGAVRRPADLGGQALPALPPYLVAARQLGLSPGRCLVVEDAPAGVRSAREAGCTVVAVTSTHCGADLAGAHAVVDGLAELVLADPVPSGG